MINRKFVEGIAIIAKYVDPEEYAVRAEHDQLWFGDDEVVSAEDAARLEELGWFRSDEGGWSCFT